MSSSVAARLCCGSPMRTSGVATARHARRGVLWRRDLPLLLRTLTPARWAVLDRLRAAGPASIYQLAKGLGRDYKNVHTDVTALLGIGLIERTSDARVSVPWDVIRAEF